MEGAMENYIIIGVVLLLEGMHCKHCKARVEEAVADIHGVAGRVDLKKGVLTVYYAQPVEDEVIYKKIRKAGYIAKKQ